MAYQVPRNKIVAKRQNSIGFAYRFSKLTNINLLGEAMATALFLVDRETHGRRANLRKSEQSVVHSSGFLRRKAPVLWKDPPGVNSEHWHSWFLHHAGPLGEDLPQELAGVGGGVAGDLFGRSLGDDVTAFVATFGAQVNDPVGRLDDLGIVFDDDDS